jgi:hypothetical protein
MTRRDIRFSPSAAPLCKRQGGAVCFRSPIRRKKGWISFGKRLKNDRSRGILLGFRILQKTFSAHHTQTQQEKP